MSTNSSPASSPSGETSIPAVQTLALGKSYGAVNALNAIDVSIEDNEYFVLLGPSGGGKTTLLRLIGGFVRASSGKVLLHGQNMTDVPPERRVTSMVFQSYALFPHMNVRKNVGYGLRLQKLSAAQIAQRTDAMLEMVGLAGYGERKPHELSGGQQQRVQLARSLVLQRDVLLLDEPLAALDARLRKDMCFELKRIQEEVGITFVHVTHNQEEAMTVADRMAIISGGDLIEQGTPREVYERPQHRFTAEFIGENSIFDGAVLDSDSVYVSLDLGYSVVSVPSAGQKLRKGEQLAVSIPSERMCLLANGTAPPQDDAAWQTLSGTLVKQTYFGLTSTTLVRLADGTDVVVRELTRDVAGSLQPGQAVAIAWRRDDGRVHCD